MSAPKLELVSFTGCPYVQRSVITLKHKNVPFTAKEIDLENPPEWFLKISPMGKVPVLVIDGKTSLFESAVINEYVDEITEPRLNPKEPLQKALERSWIEYSSELLMQMYGMAFEEDRTAFESQKTELFESIEKLEPVISNGPFFRGAAFSLVDTSYAPFFMRLSFAAQLWEHAAWKKMPKTRKWAEALLDHSAVKASVPSDFRNNYTERLKKEDSFLVK